jgi:hypothetical protein
MTVTVHLTLIVTSLDARSAADQLNALSPQLFVSVIICQRNYLAP